MWIPVDETEKEPQMHIQHSTPISGRKKPRPRHLPHPMGWADRIQSYLRLTAFPHAFSEDDDLFTAASGLVCGVWFLGNDYRAKASFYGEFPPNFLRRTGALFPDKERVLHLFSGMVDLKAMPGDTCDINPEFHPTFVADAHDLSGVPLEDYDLIICDPPYSESDAMHYGTPMIDRNRVMRALCRVRPGTHIVWLDQVFPMYRKVDFALEAAIAVVRSTNHRVRMAFIFRKLPTSGG
jgi:hypothetical protein